MLILIMLLILNVIILVAAMILSMMAMLVVIDLLRMVPAKNVRLLVLMTKVRMEMMVELIMLPGCW